MTETLANWFGVRCVFELDPETRADSDPRLFEERVTIWRASGVDMAIELAEAEAVDYATILDAKYLGFAQAFKIEGPPMQGCEVFSLIRQSELAPGEYLSAFFDTGRGTRGQLSRNRMRHRGNSGCFGPAAQLRRAGLRPGLVEQTSRRVRRRCPCRRSPWSAAPSPACGVAARKRCRAASARRRCW